MPLKPNHLREFIEYDPVKSPKELARRFPSLEYRQTRNGIGVAATVFIPAGTYLGQVGGALILDKFYGSNYCMTLEPWGSLEPDAPFGYVNHSCDPNCAFIHIERQDDRDRPALPDVWFITQRDIECGEELSIDYGWPASNAIPCNCGSPKCRGWIVDQKQLHLIPGASHAEKIVRKRSPKKSHQAANR